MDQLSLPVFDIKIKQEAGATMVFDQIRKKYVVLTPEEWVRQHCIHYLVEEKYFPAGRMLLEREIRVNSLSRRVDLAVCDADGRILLLVECKAPEVPLNQEVFDQVARYNLPSRAACLMLTNGVQHIYCQIDYDTGKYLFLKELPDYNQLQQMR